MIDRTLPTKEGDERMSDEEAIAQLRKTVAAGERALLFPSYNAQVVVLGVIDRLRSELSTRPLPEGAVGDGVGEREVEFFTRWLDGLAERGGKGAVLDNMDARAIGRVSKLITRFSASLRSAEERFDLLTKDHHAWMMRADKAESALALAVAERDRAREALNEVITNGHWSGGPDFAGEWCISREVYETATDALTAPADGKE